MIIDVRASSLGELLDCPARWEAKHLLGRRLPRSPAAQLGTAIHASTAAYDGSRLNGNPLTIDESAAAAVDAIHKPDGDVDWEEESPQEAEGIAVALHTKYCETIAPQQDYAAVEVLCDRLEIADLGIALTGTTDRVRRIGEGYGIADIKTGKTAVSADGTVSVKGHTYQLGVYELLAERAAGLPITEPAEVVGLNTAKTAKAQRVGTGTVEGAREVLLGDEDQPGILQTVAAVIKAGNFWGNPKSMMCGVRYCPVYHACRYRR